VGIHGESAGGVVALRQATGQELDPLIFGDGTAGAGVLEKLAAAKMCRYPAPLEKRDIRQVASVCRP
jgi:hypothetical protein